MMTLMMGTLHEALVDGGTSADTAKKAAEKVAAYDNRLTRIDGELVLVTWMIGLNIALTAAVLAKVLV